MKTTVENEQTQPSDFVLVMYWIICTNPVEEFKVAWDEGNCSFAVVIFGCAVEIFRLFKFWNCFKLRTAMIAIRIFFFFFECRESSKYGIVLYTFVPHPRQLAWIMFYLKCSCFPDLFLCIVIKSESHGYFLSWTMAVRLTHLQIRYKNSLYVNMQCGDCMRYGRKLIWMIDFLGNLLWLRTVTRNHVFALVTIWYQSELGKKKKPCPRPWIGCVKLMYNRRDFLK